MKKILGKPSSFFKFPTNCNGLPDLSSLGRRSMCVQIERAQSPGKKLLEVGTSVFSASDSAVNAPQQKALYETKKSTYFKAEEKARVGSSFDQLESTLNYVKQEKDVVEKHKIPIKEGDIINLHDLLFTKNRNYLIKYTDNDQRVNVEQLEGKIVVLFFISLSSDCNVGVWGNCISCYKDWYNELEGEKKFEIIFVGVNDYDPSFTGKPPDPLERFGQLFSSMPWAGIPFSDIASRKHLQRTFGISENLLYPMSVIVDSKGMVLQRGSCNFLQLYENQGYPINDNKIKLLHSEYEVAAKQPSLTTILGSHHRDYVISNRGDKVPIQSLEDKVVALYFYEDGKTDDRITDRLKRVYHMLAQNCKNFEVVLIYLRGTDNKYESPNAESFWKKFKTMPWLALPCNDQNRMKLKRIFEYEYDEHDKFFNSILVIFGPHGEFIEPSGSEIVLNCDIEAYPFTCEKLAKLESDKAKELNMEMLVDPNTVLKGKDGIHVRLCQLTGKRTILYFQKHKDCDRFIERLKDRYLQMKGSDDEFEVIHIVCGDKEFLYNKVVADVPWLVHPFGYSSELLDDVFGFKYYDGYERGQEEHAMVAFDQDGKVVRKTIFPWVGYMDFPFSAVSMEDEAFFQLDRSFQSGYFGERDEGIYYHSRIRRAIDKVLMP